ncbi:hypothetical protein APHACPA_0753 [Rickettsia amblyommatis str. Ac/Pa]|uniref:Uncharacterized protein n=1 Tax=Rickettsia amblyommatis str. Ac/Pa TaxID=1359164 RepID=A0A0F3N4B7_RICAM|nr:hypothetical protein APHACPA_0753 [Rickettsia amblyommatis str. Ac/Pa]
MRGSSLITLKPSLQAAVSMALFMSFPPTRESSETYKKLVFYMFILSNI